VNLFKSAQQLDDAVLGQPETSRGSVGNLLLGLHPVMAPVWALVAVVCVLATIWQLGRGSGLGAVGPGMLALASAASAFASRRRKPSPPRG
jgi:hypothetical protein